MWINKIAKNLSHLMPKVPIRYSFATKHHKDHKDHKDKHKIEKPVLKEEKQEPGLMILHENTSLKEKNWKTLAMMNAALMWGIPFVPQVIPIMIFVNAATIANDFGQQFKTYLLKSESHEAIYKYRTPEEYYYLTLINIVFTSSIACSLTIKSYEISFLCMFVWFGVHIFANRAPKGYLITAGSLLAAYAIYLFKDNIFQGITGKKKESQTVDLIQEKK